jgi:hypothetical protein
MNTGIRKNHTNEFQVILNNNPTAASKRGKILNAIHELSHECEYPITSYGDFIKKTGKKEIFIADKTVVLQDCAYLKCLIRTIPAYYFPISNQDDFVDKAKELL